MHSMCLQIWKTQQWQCRRPQFNPWVGKIPWRRKCQPTPVLLPGEFHGEMTWQATVHRIAELNTPVRLTFTFPFSMEENLLTHIYKESEKKERKTKTFKIWDRDSFLMHAICFWYLLSKDDTSREIWRQQCYN